MSNTRPNPVALVVPSSEMARLVQRLFDPKILRVVYLGQVVAGWRFQSIMVTREAWEQIQDFPTHTNTQKLAWWQDTVLTRLSSSTDQVIYL